MNRIRKDSCREGQSDGPSLRTQTIQIPLSSLHGYRVSSKKTKLVLVSKDTKIYDAFYFQFGNSDKFTLALNNIIKTRRAHSDKNYYVIMGMRTEHFPKSFSDISLNAYSSKGDVWNMISYWKSHPYESTLSAFSKVSDYVLYKPPDIRPDEEGTSTAENNLCDHVTDGVMSENEESYHIIKTQPSLPCRERVQRTAPLSVHQWAVSMNSEGKISNVDDMKRVIFNGGIADPLRYEAWKYLLNYYPWESTHAERQDIKKTKVEEYFKMKLQWKSISAEQEARFSQYRDRRSLIEKDVHRTDRTLPFYSGDSNHNLTLLYDILMTYGMYNFDLGYVQGMSDILSPILYVMCNEVDAFWCFVGFMERLQNSFDMGEFGMKKQLKNLFELVSCVSPDLGEYLAKVGANDMFFCFRWIIVWFKREMSFNDIMLLWEVLWTEMPCKNFHLLICVAVLDRDKSIIMENNFTFTEILAHVNGLSGKLEVDYLLTEGEAIFRQLENTPDLKPSVKYILGLAQEEVDGSLSDADSSEVVDSPDFTTLEALNLEDKCDQAIQLNYL